MIIASRRRRLPQKQRNPKYIHIIIYQNLEWDEMKNNVLSTIYYYHQRRRRAHAKWEEDAMSLAWNRLSLRSTVQWSAMEWWGWKCFNCNQYCTYDRFKVVSIVVLSVVVVLVLWIQSSSIYLFYFYIVCGPGEWLIRRITYSTKVFHTSIERWCRSSNIKILLLLLLHCSAALLLLTHLL